MILIATLTGLVGIFFVIYLALGVLRKDPGNSQMQALSNAIHEGAMTFLKREYKVIAIFIAILFLVLSWGINILTAVSYLIGAGCSLLAGFIGMQISTRANTRTTQAATKGFSAAMDVAFPGGAVMGISVVSFGLFALSLLYFVFTKSGIDHLQAVSLIAGFSMGASSVALFARVGGGIYTKAADVGADLVGKVEAGIPEDDPRNPAVIADLVGDNVGDVAGMGADLYESYVGAIISGMILAAATFPTLELKLKGIFLCFLLAATGVISSIIGGIFVRLGENLDPQKSLRNGTWGSAILFALGAFALIYFWHGSISLFYAAVAGLISGIVIGLTAEFYTSGKAIEKIAQSSSTGPATTIIQGLATGMQSVALPLIIIAAAIITSYHFAGIFGIAVAAIGMLSIAGMTVSVDAYGPIADNSGGIAEMAHLPPEVRKVTDRLDAVGNTTAAIAKGFAIGSAALTALALFSAYTQVTNLESINVMQPLVIAGLFVGGIIPFVFAASAMQAVGRAAFEVVSEVRRQFKEIAGLMQGTARAEYAKCVDITTRTALREMIVPGLMAVIIPLVVGIILGKEALAGLLAGALITGVPLAIFLANSGGAWDNAKKYIEAGNLGGKGSATHKAAVIGDTVGDPFKDTAAPSMNILLKLMTVVALVFGPTIVLLHQHIINLVKTIF